MGGAAPAAAGDPGEQVVAAVRAPLRAFAAALAQERLYLLEQLPLDDRLVQRGYPFPPPPRPAAPQTPAPRPPACRPAPPAADQTGPPAPRPMPARAQAAPASSR